MLCHIMTMTKCTITKCKGHGIKKYDLYNDKPHFMTLLLCKKHSNVADKVLAKRDLQSKPDGTYKKKVKA